MLFRSSRGGSSHGLVSPWAARQGQPQGTPPKRRSPLLVLRSDNVDRRDVGCYDLSMEIGWVSLDASINGSAGVCFAGLVFSIESFG